jgi:hypothetical protein
MRRSAPSGFRWASVPPRRDRDAALCRAQLRRDSEYLSAIRNAYECSDGEDSPVFARSPVFADGEDSPSPSRAPAPPSLADVLRRAPVSPPPMPKRSRSSPTPSQPAAMVAPANEVTPRPSERRFGSLFDSKASNPPLQESLRDSPRESLTPPPKRSSLPLPDSTLEDFGYTTDQPDQPAIQPVTQLPAVVEQWQDDMIKRFAEAYGSNVYFRMQPFVDIGFPTLQYFMQHMLPSSSPCTSSCLPFASKSFLVCLLANEKQYIYIYIYTYADAYVYTPINID